MEVDDLTKLASGVNTLWHQYLNNDHSGGSGGDSRTPCDLQNFPVFQIGAEGFYGYEGKLIRIYWGDENSTPNRQEMETEAGDYLCDPKIVEMSLNSLPEDVIYRLKLGARDPNQPLSLAEVMGWTIQIRSHNGDDDCRPALYLDPWLVDAKGTYHIQANHLDKENHF